MEQTHPTLAKVVAVMCLIVFALGFIQTVDAADRELWIYCPANFLVEAECQRVHKVMERAAQAGYTHMLVADSKFSRLHEMGKRYIQHIEQLKAKAASLKIALVPACCPVGYSNDLLGRNPNMAEALPVREALYVVNGNQAIHAPDPNVKLPSLTDRKQWGFIDEGFVASENGLVASPPFRGNARIMKPIRTQKFQQYHASVWIKTEDLTPQVELKVLDRQGHNLSYTSLNAKATQDWTEHHVTFNSLDNDQLNFYIGVWGPKTGKLWLRDPKLEVTGAVNMVRRTTAPIRVQWLSGSEVIDLKEEVDFAAWRDTRLGQVPYAGEYEAWHEPPPIALKRTFPSDARLKVSYFHTHIIHEGQVCGAIGDSEFETLLKQQVAEIGKLMQADVYMMSHDEYRVMGWTPHSLAGLSPEASPGELLTHNAKVCYQAILQTNPQARVLTWSDMFDPYHNAVAKYYLVNGSLQSASLPKPVWVMNWNSDKQAESLKHFDRLGHRQIIAGYYDAPTDQINGWLNTVVENQISSVQGVMYTTWVNDHQQLEAFAAQVKAHRWYKSPLP